jgi:hypothetical protein
VYDDLQPASRSGVLEREPLFARLSASPPAIGLSNGCHDLAHVATELGVIRLDVLPGRLTEDDASGIGIERRRKHPTIVPSVVSLGNPLLETCP